LIDALVAYVHYLGIMTLMAALVSEHLLIGGTFDLERARQLVTTDVIFGAAAAAVLLSGVLRMFYFGKGAAYYLGNPLYHAKLTLFVVAALLSVYPTVQFRSWRPDVRAGRLPDVPVARLAAMRRVLRFELLLVVLMPLLAVMMGRGVGY
jgi:putative membrane protein